MFLNKIKAFVFQEGIGLKIIIPFSFLLSLILSYQFVQPFKESLKTTEIQETIEFILKDENKIINTTKTNSLIPNQVNLDNYAKIITEQALLTLKEQGLTKNLSKEQINQLLLKAFDLQTFFLGLIIAIICLFGFLFIYLFLTIIGPLFYNDLEKNMWGRILTLVYPPLLLIWVIGFSLKLNLGFIYLFAITTLISLLIGVYLKKNN